MNRALSLCVLALMAGAVWAADRENLSADQVRFGQGMADSLRSATGADFAFVPAGVLVDDLAGKTLASALLFPTEEVSVLKLTGAQVRQALERSVSLFPTNNPAFLHVSGLEVSFRASSTAETRLVSVTGVDASQTYRVAMPSSLARGGLGYFTVWNRQPAEPGLELTMEQVLKTGQPDPGPARWRAVGG
ncbi:MAG: 5'-nucleotidase C-terminal domain-containing protein [Fimbriimonadaceae bacterium]|nr:5'-nucleotidase C-terminal domain-containing protein [Fimbriimonadaceae bacterium]